MKLSHSNSVTSRLGSLFLSALLTAGVTTSAYGLTGTLVVHGPPGGGNTPPTVACNNPTSNGGWIINDSPAVPVLTNFTTGPGTPPLNTGSVLGNTGATPTNQARALLFTSFGGAPLSLLASLISPTLTGYDLYPTSATGGEAMFFLFVSYDGGTTTSDQLQFVPALNGCFAPGNWTTCNFMGGNFTNANPLHDPTGMGGSFTLAQYIAFGANSAAVVPSLAASQPTLGVISAGGASVGAALDKFVLNSTGPALNGPFTTLQWDFEADCTNYGGDTDGDCYCDSLNPLVANRDKCAGLSNSLCTAAATPFDCCTGSGTGTCNDQTDTDSDGLGDLCDNCPNLGNATCTGAGTPNACCTGAGTGTCTDQTDDDGDGIGDLCDAALCPPTPDSCLSASKNTFKIKDNTDASKQTFNWKWKGGAAPATQADYGDPVNGSGVYSVCVYDTTASTPTLVSEFSIASGGTCSGKPCWDSTAQDKGWSYKNKTGNSAGITKVRFNSGAAGKPLIQVTGKGANLTSVLPAPISAEEFFDQDPSVTVQLYSSDSGLCWGSTFTTNKKNDSTQFSAIAP